MNIFNTTRLGAGRQQTVKRHRRMSAAQKNATTLRFWITGAGLRCLCIAGALLAGPAQAGTSTRGGLLLRVGSDAACDHSTLQAALDASKANGPGVDLIWISKNHSDTQINALIEDQSVTIVGGFDDCQATAASGHTVLDGSGGALASVIRILTTTADQPQFINLEHLTIKGGEDSGSGGGIDIAEAAQVRLTDVHVSENHSTHGGGIALHGSNSRLILAQNTLINNNTASGDGGGIHCSGGIVFFNEGLIILNSAGRGGGAMVTGDCLFQQLAGGINAGTILNQATLAGGGIAVENGQAILLGSANRTALVSLNSAGFFGGGLALIQQATVSASHAHITQNEAASAGGGVYVGSNQNAFNMQQMNAIFCPDGHCSSLSDNHAGDSGGGIYNAGLSFIRQTLMQNNSSEDSGVGSAATAAAGQLILEGDVITGNHGGQHVLSGGGGGHLTVAHVSVADNAVNESLIALQLNGQPAASFNLLSSLLADDAATPILSQSSNTPLTLDCLLVHESTTLPGATRTQVGPPGFVDPASNNYHLSEDSLAIDFCDDSQYVPLNDVDNQTRGWDHPTAPNNMPGHVFDLGADEWRRPDLIYLSGFEAGM